MKIFSLIFVIWTSALSQNAYAGLSKNRANLPIVAIIDTGFDTTHPAIAAPIVDSYDYSKETNDISPYIFRPTQSGEVFRRISSLLELEPELSKWFSLDRDVENEFRSAAFHGTAVASLSVYDLAVYVALYKVYPIPKDVDPDEWMTKSVAAAIQRAIQHGAQVINLSLGFTFQVGATDVPKHQKLMQVVADVIHNNPHVFFIAATGNENQTIDNVNISGYPCGLSAKNVLCVGAISHDKRPWKVSSTKGTNFVSVAGAETVFSYGDHVFSAIPQKMCVTTEAINALFSKEPVSKKMATELLKSCKEKSSYIDGEGTSIATPLVTRTALRILSSQPLLTTSELKQQVLNCAQTLSPDPRVKYIEPARPSWAKSW